MGLFSFLVIFFNTVLEEGAQVLVLGAPWLASAGGAVAVPKTAHSCMVCKSRQRGGGKSLQHKLSHVLAT